MPTHHETQILPYTPQQLYALVADIERYPDFLPWCRAARILEWKGNVQLAELIISFKGLTESYVSRVALTPPENGEGSIDVQLVRGPFQHLANHWKFVAHESGTALDFFVDFRFKSRILEGLIGGLFERATVKMVNAFKARAEELYGAK
jgi:coenzyme Q-binding protein COQ10